MSLLDALLPGERTLISIVGPTAVGKTRLSLALAQRFGTEILSCDSRQVYIGMDIGTAKPTPAERGNIPHHFIDCRTPDQPYHAAAFAEEARALLHRLFETHEVVVMVGGSTLYAGALWYQFDEIPPVREGIREALKLEWETHGLEPLLAELAENDPVTYARIDRKNPIRVTRALEVWRSTGQPISAFQSGNSPQGGASPDPWKHLRIGLRATPREALYTRIDARVREMFDQGLVDEVQALLNAGYSLEHQALRSIGYEEVVHYLLGESTLDRCIYEVQRNSRHYAKRQLTWFQRDASIRWMEAGEGLG